ncbi:MAG: PAS domain-containing protein [Dehalococcoidia bacterium]|nr:PAS domain-containing protein [Dehalococcoidia bacterium]
MRYISPEVIPMHADTFRRFATEVPVALFQTALDGHCTFVNRRWMELTGLCQHEATGSGWLQFIDIRDRSRIVREWFESRHTSDFVVEWRAGEGPATGRRVRASVALLWDDSGIVTGYAVALAATEPTSRYELHERGHFAGRRAGMTDRKPTGPMVAA